MSKGMSEKEYQSRMREIVFIFFGAPAAILIGMTAIGAIIDNILKATNTFSYLFSIIGGIPAIGMYFYSEWKRFVNREIPESEVSENQKKILNILYEINGKI
jgi:hypothetical protein